MRTYKALFRGKVQGLGFRPYVYRLAKAMGVTGFVANSRRGVEILAQGAAARRFLSELTKSPPPLARVTSADVRQVSSPRHKDFRIVRSRDSTGGATGRSVEVLPDLAVCPDCRKEISRPRNRRYRYPFTNCTQCGPRYTIIQSLPYDRPGTTMRSFVMCPECRAEYETPLDRRFHAQPNACPKCGPELALKRPGTAGQPAGDALVKAAKALQRGRIVAIKSLGGFQLACDATSEEAVKRLRRRKARPHKPLALMCDRLATTRLFCNVSPAETRLLQSAAAPIVLMRRRRRAAIAIPSIVAPGNHRLGVMLPYTPLHLLLFQELRALTGKPVVLVMTSANRKDSPIIAEDRELASELGSVFDLALTHNRPIANRCDDSVVLAADEQEAVCRRKETSGPGPVITVRAARGYAPVVVRLEPMFHVKHPTLAVGADMRNAFCLASGDRAVVSPHIGDMGSPRTEQFFLETLARLTDWTGIRPERVACDLHPDYFSTRLAERLAREWNAPVVRVQHHFAHTASTMVEHGLTEPVLGLALDGTGYGTDGAIWGCEFLVVKPDFAWQRVGHLGYLRLPGPYSELADPVTIGSTYLAQARGENRGLRGPETSSLGRLFDAVAGLTGACMKATFDGQAAVALEAAAARHAARQTREIRRVVAVAARDDVIAPAPILLQVKADLDAGLAPGVVAARFHDVIGQVLSRTAVRIARRYGVRTVTLSGGAAQNSLLRNCLSARLSSHGLRLVYNTALAVNDGGICLGQALAAGLLPASRPF